MIRRWIPVCTAAIILIASLGSAHAARIESITISADGLKEQVTRWVDELSNQPSFENWKEASIDISALGPGTHGWYVNIVNGGQAVGYMIVNARSDGGFTLGEYGLGVEPMFAARPLHRSLVQLELIPSSYFKLAPADQKQNPMFTAERLYLSPLHSVWKVTLVKQKQNKVHYFDAKTGEYLPINDSQWTAAREQSELITSDETAAELSFIQTSQTNKSFDPYERFPWLTQAPIQGELLQVLKTALNRQHKIWFSSEPYDESTRYVWPVIGYHIWDNNQMFIAVEQEGSRFIPLASLTSHGHFYN
ncbi:hypothetical protein AB6A23_16850 [Paenibacillus tarimensis]